VEVHSADEIASLADEVAATYWLGGPPIAVADDVTAFWDAADAHEQILDVLDTHDCTTTDRYLDTLYYLHLDTVAGLRALLRLVAANGAGLALSWVLGEPDPVYADGPPVSRADVLAGAAAVRPAAFNDNVDDIER
jgi:hypothetical protein